VLLEGLDIVVVTEVSQLSQKGIWLIIIQCF
jgi:hypothetical protein